LFNEEVEEPPSTFSYLSSAQVLTLFGEGAWGLVAGVDVILLRGRGGFLGSAACFGENHGV
jgi:hypothetical protein